MVTWLTKCVNLSLNCWILYSCYFIGNSLLYNCSLVTDLSVILDQYLNIESHVDQMWVVSKLRIGRQFVRLDVCVSMSVCPSACLCGYVRLSAGQKSARPPVRQATCPPARLPARPPLLLTACPSAHSPVSPARPPTRAHRSPNRLFTCHPNDSPRILSVPNGQISKAF